MPKSLLVDPKEVRKSGTVNVRKIALNKYEINPKMEEKKYGIDTLQRIYHDMFVIREFESMLNAIKTEGSYRQVSYNHLGPAHLSIGQEATSVGMCLGLAVDDFIFGSHRSHGEIIAKCFSAIEQLTEDELLPIMKSYLDGDCLRVVEKDHHGSMKDLAHDFVLYGTLAEIFARAYGINRGFGGSMHAFFSPFGSMPNNAIVGGSGDISVGAALYKRINRKPGIVIANIGDASMGCGPVWEAMVLSSMDQYRNLWDPDIGGAPPILFNFINNFYGMGGQTAGETMGYQVLARVGAGLNPENMHAERIDGYHPIAVADAIERKKKILLQGKGPVLLDSITYRLSGHSPSDASTYRTKEDINLWEESDCLESYASYLLENGFITKDKIETIREGVIKKIEKAVKRAVPLDVSPRLDGEEIGKVMFSNRSVEKMEDRKSEVLIPINDNPRVKAIRKKSRFGLDQDGKPLPKTKVFSLRDAIFEALLHRFYIDPTMIAYGEENRDWGGAFAVYRGLTESLPYHRLFNTSISEGAIVGSAVGYAMCGGRVVAELMYCDFMGRAGDELFNQMSKWQAMSAGLLTMPLTLRVSVGNKYGAQHSQDWTSLVAHVPGLKVMFPATPYDAKGMMNLALRGTDPVVFFESQRIYDVGELFAEGGVPEGYYEIPEGQAVVRRQGSDLSILTVGATLYKALEAADILEKKYHISCEVIDARFINPLEYGVIIESVQKTGKIILASDACERGSYLHTIASNISQLAFDCLDGPVAVVGSRNWITPAAEMETTFFPQKEWIIDTIHERLLPLEAHEVTTNQTIGEMERRNRAGV